MNKIAKEGEVTAREPHVIAQIQGRVGFLTLNRPEALNALSLSMVRELTHFLRIWRDDPEVLAVVVRGAGKNGVLGGAKAFCAGGDIRFFHQAALKGTLGLSQLADFFTDEYTLNHLIHTYPKPYLAFMEGVVMGGGMGISQGASVRVVCETTKIAMPETQIGLFPDVGGGYFLSRCPGHVGEWLALTGQILNGSQAIRVGLADGSLDTVQLPAVWQTLASTPFESSAAVEHYVTSKFAKPVPQRGGDAEFAPAVWAHIDTVFALPTVQAMVEALAADQQSSTQTWSAATLAVLRKRSPLLLHVVLAQIRRARAMSLADDLRMERDLVHHCFHLRPGAKSETVEGIRALVVDKDHDPQWHPARIEDVTPEMVAPFFVSPWAAQQHPLSGLK